MILGSIGRFHFLEQGRALVRLGALDRHYCDDPRVLGLGPGRGRWMARAAAEFRWRLRRSAQDAYALGGNRLRDFLAGHQVVRINSGFALECTRAGIDQRVWVDHGSLDERHVGRVLDEEARAWGEPIFRTGGNHSLRWLVDRQAEEFARAAGVVVASRLALRTLAAEGVPENRVRVVPLGVDAERFRPRQPPVGERRRFRFLHAGPVSFNKGIHRLLASFGRGLAAHCELWIAGRFAAPEMEAWLRRRAAGLPVVFLPPVAQRKLPELFSACDAFVLASLADGFGLTVLQAMACGLPAIVSRQAGCAELLAGAAAVRIAGLEDEHDLAEAMGEMREWAARTPSRERAELARAAAQPWSWTRHAAELRARLEAA